MNNSNRKLQKQDFLSDLKLIKQRAKPYFPNRTMQTKLKLLNKNLKAKFKLFAHMSMDPKQIGIKALLIIS